MGQLVIPIGINLDSIKKVFGCKDELLFQNILQSETYNKFDEDFSVKKELHDIIFNYVPKKNRIIKRAKFFGLVKGNDGRGLEGDWNEYGYALLSICCYLGTRFSLNFNEYICGDSWKRIDKLMREKKFGNNLSFLLESQQIFDTPFEQNDIWMNYHDRTEIMEFINLLSTIENEIESEDLKLFYSLKKGFFNCLENNLGLINFSFEFIE